MVKDFVPFNIGPAAIERKELVHHSTYISKQLFDSADDELILVADRTYCYYQKSFNNSFQRKSYSVRKGRHLVKSFVICTTDGYIVGIYGLFEALKNDASILSNLLKTNEDLRSILKENATFVLDRGFRDCVKELKDKYKFKVKMPALLSKNQKQLNSLYANLSRFVTKIRWVVEVINTFF